MTPNLMSPTLKPLSIKNMAQAPLIVEKPLQRAKREGVCIDSVRNNVIGAGMWRAER